MWIPDASLTDGGMEIWTDATHLTNWGLFFGYGQLNRESTIKLFGSYSAKLTRVDANGAAIIQDIQNNNGHNLAYWKGRHLIAGGWCKANHVISLQLYDGIGFHTVLKQHTGGNDWEYLVSSITISASATVIYIWPLCGTAAGNIAYWDGVSIIQGFVPWARNGVPIGTLGKINGVAIANIGKINGVVA